MYVRFAPSSTRFVRYALLYDVRSLRFEGWDDITTGTMYVRFAPSSTRFVRYALLYDVRSLRFEGWDDITTGTTSDECHHFR